MHQSPTGGLVMRVSIMTQLVGITALALASQLHAQRPPAIPGVTGTIVTEETAKDEKKAADKAGAAVKDALTPADNKGPLSDLRPGTTVVIKYADVVTEGIVSKIDRGANQISVRYDNKKVETMVLTDRDAAGARTVEYSDEARHKVTRYFRLKS
jgi:hypothetical protein